MGERDRFNQERIRLRRGEQPPHSYSEVRNSYACQKIISAWQHDRTLSSKAAIHRLYGQLMDGMYGVSREDAETPYRGGDYTSVRISRKPADFLVSAFLVGEAMDAYIEDLDKVLEKGIVAPEVGLAETVHDAAWAYYAFERIHPFLDGNGRTGRNILKRVLQGRGYKDVVFQPNIAYKKSRGVHLDALDLVGDSGNLAHLEVYLLKQMRRSYEGSMALAIDTLITQKEAEIEDRQRAHPRGESVWNVWSRFEDFLPTWGPNRPRRSAT